MSDTVFIAHATPIRAEWLNGVNQVAYRDCINAINYGATGNGSTDDTSALQAALDTGKDVFVPGTPDYYKISAALTLGTNQRIFGVGERSQIRQTTSHANGISATGVTGAVVENLKVYAVGDMSSMSNGAGIAFISSSSCRVSACTVENHRGAGALLYNTNDSLVEGNTFLNSPVADFAGHTTGHADVSVVYSSSHNRVLSNLCASGQSTGIQVQSVVDGDSADDNIIRGNTIRNAKAYGIFAYRNSQSLPALQSVQRTVISLNTIENTQGSIVNETVSNYSFGCAIYVQGAEGTSVTGNTIKGTHKAAVTFTETLAPGAIGCTNVTRFTITGNTIDDCGMFGIDVGDPNTFGDTVGFAAISGNIISNCVKSAIKVRKRGRLVISGNAADTALVDGIAVNTSSVSAALPDVTIVGNNLRNITGTGINASWVDVLSVTGNTVDTAGIHGISVGDSTTVSVCSNSVNNHVTRGIEIASTCAGVVLGLNNVEGTGASTEGYRISALSVIGPNRASGCVTRWVGTFAVLRGTQSGTAVGNVGTGEDDLHTYALPASAMVVTGDSLSVNAWGTAANNENVKTLKVYWGSQLILTATLTANQLSPWNVEAQVIRTASSAQRCFAKFTQGGTITQAFVNTPVAGTQTETAGITFKLTGEATNTNDIQQTGMDVVFKQG